MGCPKERRETEAFHFQETSWNNHFTDTDMQRFWKLTHSSQIKIQIYDIVQLLQITIFAHLVQNHIFAHLSMEL